jgi:hypothetical protein
MHLPTHLIARQALQCDKVDLLDQHAMDAVAGVQHLVGVLSARSCFGAFLLGMTTAVWAARRPRARRGIALLQVEKRLVMRLPQQARPN